MVQDLLTTRKTGRNPYRVKIQLATGKDAFGGSAANDTAERLLISNEADFLRLHSLMAEICDIIERNFAALSDEKGPTAEEIMAAALRFGGWK